MFLDYYLDSQIYPRRTAPCMVREFTSRNVGGTECIVMTQNDAKGWIMFCHGNLDTLDSLWEAKLPQKIAERCKCNVIIPEFPAKHSTGLAHDQATIDTFKAAYNRLRLDTKAPVYVLAHSLGVALALHACTDQAPNGMVLASGFSSIRNLAPTYVSCMLPDRLNNVRAIAQYKCPIHIVHGKEDPIIPYAHSLRLKQAYSKAVLHGIDKMQHNPTSWNTILDISTQLMTETTSRIETLTYPSYRYS